MDAISNVSFFNTVVMNVYDQDGTFLGNPCDVAGYESIGIILNVGAYTDGEFTFVVKDSDTTNAEDFVEVEEDQLVHAFPVVDSDSYSYTHFKVLYRGYKRYVKVEVEISNTTDGAFLEVAFLRFGPAQAPVEDIVIEEEE